MSVIISRLSPTPFGFALAQVSGYAAAGLLRPNDTQPILIVLHITPTSLERHSLNEKDQDVSFITPFADGLYGMCPGSIPVDRQAIRTRYS